MHFQFYRIGKNLAEKIVKGLISSQRKIAVLIYLVLKILGLIWKALGAYL
jgi:hypothetical protein